MLHKPATHDCVTEYSTDGYHIHPRKVVIRPWFGRHHVFGVFMVPYVYRSGRTYSGVISVEGFLDELSPDSQPPVEHAEEMVAEPGHYLIRAYVPTRVAVWFLLKGQFGDLQMPCNWTFELKKRTSGVETSF